MLFGARTRLAVISLVAAAGLAFIASANNRAQAQTRSTVHAQTKHVLSAWQRHRLEHKIHAYQHAAAYWRSRAMFKSRPHRLPRRLEGLEGLRHELIYWKHRDWAAWHYVKTHPWIRMVARTRAYRACIIGHESATAGLYKAENGGTRYVEPGGSNASGAYQFLNSTWQTRLAHAKRYFKGKLKGWWSHAADAPPKVQDIVAAYAILADKGVDWTHPDCRAKGVAPA